MIHAEVAHGMRVERCRQRDREQETRQFHYNGSLRNVNRFGLMRRVITYQDIPPSGELQVPPGTVITPSARDLATERGVTIAVLPADQIRSLASPEKTVAIGSD